jgi:hypothetical protein
MVEDGILLKTVLFSRRSYLEGGLEFGCDDPIPKYIVLTTRLAKVWSIRESNSEEGREEGRRL